MNVMVKNPGVSALQDDLRNKGVKYIIGAYVDIHGAQKGKVVPIDHLPHMVDGSELYTGYALDGLGQEPNEDEFASVPDLAHVIQLPWEPKLAWSPADLSFHGKPYPLSTRVALKQQIAKAAEMGFGFNLGVECEIFVLKQAADGSLHTPDPNDKLIKPCYDVRGFMSNFSWLDKMASVINDLGWDLVFLRPRGRLRPIRIRLHLRRCPDDLRPRHLLPHDGQTLCRGGRAGRDDDAEALRRSHRQWRAFQHVAS